MSESTNPLVAAVRKHATENHEKSFGWSEVEECYEDTDIERIIEGSTTPEEAIAKMQEIVGIRDERFREAIGPEVECKQCGTKFGENTCCPNCDRALSATSWDY